MTTIGYPQDQLLTAVTVNDANGFPIQEGLLKVQRRFPDGNYYTIESALTNEQGIALVRLVQYRGLYRFVVQKDCTTIFTSSPTQIAQNTLTINVPASSPLDGLISSLLNDVDYSLLANGTHYVLVFNSNNNLGYEACLNVERIGNPAWSTINESCISTASGSISIPYSVAYSTRASFFYDSYFISRVDNMLVPSVDASIRDSSGTLLPIIIILSVVGISALIGSVFVGMLLLGLTIIVLAISGFLLVPAPISYGIGFGLLALAFMMMNRGR